MTWELLPQNLLGFHLHCWKHRQSWVIQRRKFRLALYDPNIILPPKWHLYDGQNWIVMKYSGTYHKRPPKMSSLGGRSQEVVALKSLLRHFTSLAYGNSRELEPTFCSYRNWQFGEKNTVPPIEQILSLLLSKNTIMLQQLIFHFPLYHESIGPWREVKNKRKFHNFSS